MDANYKLRNRIKKFDDGALGPGWAFMQNIAEYMAYILKVADQSEVRRSFVIELARLLRCLF